MLDQITPILLTYNEAPNVARTLERLLWARDIVVVDSHSTDETLDILSSFPQVRVYQRDFDNFAAQWNFALENTGIATDWVLTLDADFVLTPELVTELDQLRPDLHVKGYRAPLVFGIQGRPLRSSLLPPLTILYRRGSAKCVADGHASKVQVDGDLSKLKGFVLHDDRKPLSEWFAAQVRYAPLEAQKLIKTKAGNLNTADRIRKLRVVAPFAALIYCLVFRGGILDGWPGVFYAFQRMFFEVMLSLNLIAHDLKLREQPVDQAFEDQEREQSVKSGIAVGNHADVT
jgi:glycosyltransferase involved in cell wall biosynthesis